jgi:DNA-binding transcriptional LysR family regulator
MPPVCAATAGVINGQSVRRLIMIRYQSPGRPAAVELRQVRYFLAVAESRHFGRAAEQLHVVQPAVSQQVSRLERELGVRLLNRNTRTVSLTAEGTAFLRHAPEILAAVERAAAAAREARSGGRILRVGTGSGLGDLLGAALADLSAAHPGLSIELTRLKEPERLSQLAAGRLGAAVVRALSDALPDGLSLHQIVTEPLVAALPAALTTPGRRTVRLAELARVPARLPSREANRVLAAAIDLAAQRAGVSLRRLPAGTDDDMLALIGANSPSWTVFYPAKARTLARTARPGVAFRRIAAPPVTITTSLAIRDDSPDARALMQAFRRCAQTR